MNLISLKELADESRWLRLLVMGKPGTGKTWLCASAALGAETSPVLYLDYHGQTTSLRSNPEFVKAMKDGRLVLLRLEKYAELSAIYNWLTGATEVPSLTNLFKEGRPKTLVIDSVTELQRAEILRRAGNSPGFQVDLAMPEIRDWGMLLNQFTLLGRLFWGLNLPIHVVFTCLEAIQLDGKQQVLSRNIALQGQAAYQLPAYALTVMRLTRAPANVKGYCIGHLSGGNAVVKDQTGRFPPKIVDPTIPKLAKLLEGGDAET